MMTPAEQKAKAARWTNLMEAGRLNAEHAELDRAQLDRVCPHCHHEMTREEWSNLVILRCRPCRYRRHFRWPDAPPRKEDASPIVETWNAGMGRPPS